MWLEPWNRQRMPKPDLFKPLTRRPSAATVTVRELLQKVEAGEIRIPRFQRPLRWTKDQVVSLLDSVWRGYPVGSLLFWKRPAPEETIQVGGAHLKSPEVNDAWWVVDGQQRTTALAASLLELDHAGDDRWLAYFDPESQQFKSGAPELTRKGRDVPLSVLGDLRRLGRWLRDCALSEDLMTVVEDAQQRLLDYSIPTYIVYTEDEQALRGVFARLNSSGARMRADEVFQALLGAPSEGGKSSLDLDALQNGCSVHGFGVPQRSEILKAVLAMSGLDPTRRLDDLKATQNLDLVSLEDAEEALSRTIKFLAADCEIPHVSVIPYPVAFFILCRWFHLFPSPESATRKLLARWVWRGIATGAHQRAEVSKMREQVRDIRPGEEQASLRRLLSNVGSVADSAWVLKRFNSKSAHSRIEILALLALRPKDQYGEIPHAELFGEGRLAREIYRSKDWRDADEELIALARSGANRVLLTSEHTGLSKELAQWHWGFDSQALDSHLIDKESFKLLQKQKISEFLRRRGDALRAEVSSFLEAKAAWKEPDLHPLHDYYETQAS